MERGGREGLGCSVVGLVETIPVWAGSLWPMWAADPVSRVFLIWAGVKDGTGP